MQKIEPARRDPDEVVQEDEEKIAKYWVNLVRKDLPKHHKHFTAYYKKQILDVKRVAEFCQREVRRASRGETLDSMVVNFISLSASSIPCFISPTFNLETSIFLYGLTNASRSSALFCTLYCCSLVVVNLLILLAVMFKRMPLQELNDFFCSSPFCSSPHICGLNNVRDLELRHLLFWSWQVKNRNVRSLKILKAAPMRTRRLARDMIIFWKKWDKEQVLELSLHEAYLFLLSLCVYCCWHAL